MPVFFEAWKQWKRTANNLVLKPSLFGSIVLGYIGFCFVSEASRNLLWNIDQQWEEHPKNYQEKYRQFQEKCNKKTVEHIKNLRNELDEKLRLQAQQ